MTQISKEAGRLIGEAKNLGGATLAMNAVTIMALRHEPDLLTPCGKPCPTPKKFRGVEVTVDNDLADGKVELRTSRGTASAEVEGVG